MMVTQYEDNISGESDTELPPNDNVSNDSIITLQNGLSYMRRRNQKAIIRWAQLQHRKKT